jgi:hypothetical protein
MTGTPMAFHHEGTKGRKGTKMPEARPALPQQVWGGEALYCFVSFVPSW